MPKATTGIAHTKRGQFVDSDGMIVGFSGSANFTLGGLFNNLEDINIFLSTSPDISIQKKIANQKAEFDRVMNGTQKEIEYLSSKDLEAAITSSYGNQDIEDLLNVEDKLGSYKQKAIRAGVLKDGEQEHIKSLLVSHTERGRENISEQHLRTGGIIIRKGYLRWLLVQVRPLLR